MSRPRRGRLTAARAGAVLLASLLFCALGVLLPATTQAVPLVPDCKESPVPEVPGRGVVGFFEPAPDAVPAAGDPFVPNSGTSIHQQYGYAGLRWNTYDLGCGPDAVRAPDATSGTALANIVMTVPKAAVAATGAVVGAALNPTFLGVFDPLIGTVVDTLRRTLFEHWMPLVLAAMGLLLLWRARSASLASSAGAIGWALLVLVIATVLFRWPLVAGQAADRTVTTTLSAVNGGLNETGPAAGLPAGTSAPGLSAGEQVTTSMHDALLYQTWLGGTFGDANAAVAKRYGPAIFDAQALTWREAATMRSDPAAGRRIIEAKQQKFADTAAKVKSQDPDAYEYLTGKRPDTRIGYALLAGFATLCAIPFLLVAGLLVLGALLIVRFGVMLFPAFATLGLFPTMRNLVIGIGETVAGAVVNAIVFGIGVALTVKGIGFVLAPGTGLPGWLRVVLVLLLSVVMWVALHPFRRMTQMVSRDGGRSAGGGQGILSRGAARAGGRLSTAFGGFAGTLAGSSIGRRSEARARAEAGPDGAPARAEATTILAAPAGTASAGAGSAAAAATPRAEAADQPERSTRKDTPLTGSGSRPAIVAAAAGATASRGSANDTRDGSSTASSTGSDGPSGTGSGSGSGNGSGSGAHDGSAVRAALIATGSASSGRFEAGGSSSPWRANGGRRGAGGQPGAAAGEPGGAEPQPGAAGGEPGGPDDEPAQLYRPGGGEVSGARR